MPTYKLTAPRQMGRIPKGFVLQVASQCSPGPNPQEVESALKQAGFTDPTSLGYKSWGNWKMERLG